MLFLQTFVSENNLYYQQDPFTTCTQVTSSGIVGEIYNGITDWLYEGQSEYFVFKFKFKDFSSSFSYSTRGDLAFHRRALVFARGRLLGVCAIRWLGSSEISLPDVRGKFWCLRILGQRGIPKGTSIYHGYLIFIITYLCQAGDRNDGINPVVRLYVVQTSNTRGAHKELLPPTDEIGEQYDVT